MKMPILLCDYRLRKKWSIERIAKRLKVSEAVYESWENGESLPNLEMLQFISEKLKIGLKDLSNAWLEDIAENEDLPDENIPQKRRPRNRERKKAR